SRVERLHPGGANSSRSVAHKGYRAMSISFSCPGCHEQLAMPDAAAGQTGRCPLCNTLFNVPAKVQPVQSQAITPARRTAVAQPMPAPVLGEDAPGTGLTIAQKTGFVAIAVGVLAFIVLLVLLQPNTDNPKNDDGPKVVADASRKVSPPRGEPSPKA